MPGMSPFAAVLRDLNADIHTWWIFHFGLITMYSVSGTQICVLGYFHHSRQIDQVTRFSRPCLPRKDNAMRSRGIRNHQGSCRARLLRKSWTLVTSLCSQTLCVFFFFTFFLICFEEPWIYVDYLQDIFEENATFRYRFPGNGELFK